MSESGQIVQNYILRLMKHLVPRDLEPEIRLKMSSDLKDSLLDSIRSGGSTKDRCFNLYISRYQSLFNNTEPDLLEQFEQTILELFQIQTLDLLERYLIRLDSVIDDNRSVHNSSASDILMSYSSYRQHQDQYNRQSISQKRNSSYRDISMLSTTSSIANDPPRNRSIPPQLASESHANGSYRSQSRVPSRSENLAGSFRSQTGRIMGKPLREYIIPFFYQDDKSLIPDSEIRKNLVFTLCGSTSELFPFDGNTIKLPEQISPGTSEFLHQLFEPALLAKHLDANVTQQQRERKIKSQVHVAFWSSINNELKSYRALVNSILGPDSTEEYGESLRNVYVSLSDSIVELRFMYYLESQLSKLSISQFLSMLYNYTNMGDLLLKDLAQRIFEVCVAPYYDVLSNWLLKGEITTESQNEEFFVIFQRHISENGSHYNEYNDELHDATMSSFKFDDTKVIQPLNKEISYIIYEVGKSLYFLKTFCNEFKWCLEYYEKYEYLYDSGLMNTPIDELETIINTQYSVVINYLSHVIYEKYHLMDEIKYFHSFLLMKKGDFINSLLVKGSKVLNDPSSKLSAHSLTTALQDSIETSSIKYFPDDAIRRLDARVLDMGHGNIGWDVFTIDFNIDSPLLLILNGEDNITKEYLRIFNFLLRLNRLSYSLSLGWLDSNNNNKRLLKEVEKRAKWASATLRRNPANHVSVYDARCLWISKVNKRLNVLRNNIVKFINTIHEFFDLEIIDKQYHNLTHIVAKNETANKMAVIKDPNFGKKRLKRFKLDLNEEFSITFNGENRYSRGPLLESQFNDYNLDEFIDIHTKYIMSITRNKIFDNSSESSRGKHSGIHYINQIGELLGVISKFITFDTDFHGALLNYASLTKAVTDIRLPADRADLNRKHLDLVLERLDILASSLQLDINEKFETYLSRLTDDLLVDSNESFRCLGNMLGS